MTELINMFSYCFLNDCDLLLKDIVNLLNLPYQ